MNRQGKLIPASKVEDILSQPDPEEEKRKQIEEDIKSAPKARHVETLEEAKERLRKVKEEYAK